MNNLTNISSPLSYPIINQQQAQTSIPSVSTSEMTTPQMTIPQPPGLEKGQVASFLKLAQFTDKSKSSWTLEEVLIEKLFSILKEITDPSQEKLSLFFSLLLALQEKTHNKDAFKKDLQLFTGKDKLEGAMAAYCILANCRPSFTTPLHVLLSESTPTEQQNPQFTELYLSSFAYLEDLYQFLLAELKELNKRQEVGIQSLKDFQLSSLPKKKKKQISQNEKNKIHLPGEERLKSFSNQVKLLDAHSKKLTVIFKKLFNQKSESTSHQLPIYQQFIFKASNSVIAGLEECIEGIEEAIKSCKLLSMNKSWEARSKDRSSYLESVLDFVTQNKIFADQLEGKSSNNETIPNIESFLSGQLSLDTFLDKSVNDLMSMYGTTKETKDIDGIINQLKLGQQSLVTLKGKLIFLRDAREKMFTLILEKLKSTRSHPEESSWLFLEDLELTETQVLQPKKTKSASSDSVKSEKNPREIFQELLQQASTESFTQIIPSHSYLLAKDIKCALRAQVDGKKISASAQVKAHKALGEISDHMHYSALNLSLFINLMRQGDFYGLKVVLPQLFLDLHIQVEQRIKFDLILKNGAYPATHSLTKLAEEGGFNHPTFFEDFNYALQDARYPFASKGFYNQPPKALQWILYALTLADKSGSITLEDVKELEQLVSFVFASYQDASHLLSKSDEIHTYINDCKDEVLQKVKALKGKNFQETRRKIKFPPSIQTCLEEAAKLKKAKVTVEVRSSLDEASSHLEQIAASHYLKASFPDQIFTPVYNRNQLIFQWVYEQLFVAQGLATRVGDLRWIRHHDLAAYSYMVHSEDFSPHDSRLDQFNFGRTLHYSREKERVNNAEPISNLLSSLKNSRKQIKQTLTTRPTKWHPSKLLNPDKIESDGANLLQDLVRDALSYF